jgi:hypothetical protein
MIKIAWYDFIWDHVWFGCYLDVETRTLVSDTPPKHYWKSSPRWMDRLWPMRRYGEVYPKWWFILWRDYAAAEAVDDQD